jgi:ubiquinone/menaquinone biosynthesis C-methylase UbiE
VCPTSGGFERRRRGYRTDVSDTSSDDENVATVFDRSSYWRASLISEFGIQGVERCAAASPTPGFPQLLDSVMFAISDAAAGPWLDVGGGLGGTASWIERTHDRRVMVTDASFAAVDGARQLFETLDVACADANRLPIRASSVPVAIVSGLVSLIADVDPIFSELRRVLAVGGRIAITDLWSSSPSTWRDRPNTFWSLEDIERRASAHGFGLHHVAIADLATGWWPLAASQITDEIVERHSGESEYDAWRRDVEHLERVRSADRVVPAAIVLG